MCSGFSVVALRAELSAPRWRKWLLAWMDGVEAGWAIPLLLIGFIAVWLAFLVIAYIGGDLHSDVLETWTLGRRFEWGYSKHPPLMGWVARAWTSVFPLTNWSFQLMALVNAAFALWTVDLISRPFVKGDKRVIVLLLLMLLPIYQFHAQRFNANAVLLATWPLATYCFLRAFENREIRWAIAAGAAGALAMLGKYYSVFLIGSFFVAALCRPQRRAYFVSWAPWVSATVMFIALVPHLHWLMETGAPPFAYALAQHTGKAFAPSLIEALPFHPWHCNDTCDSDCDLGSDCGKPPQEVFSGLSDNEPWLVAAVSCQRRNHRLSGDHFGRTRSPHAADLGITRSFPVRHSDCLRHKLPDRTLLFGQSGGPRHRHRGDSRRFGGTASRLPSQLPSIA